MVLKDMNNSCNIKGCFKSPVVTVDRKWFCRDHALEYLYNVFWSDDK